MDSAPQLRLIRSSKSKKECYKLVEGGFIYGKHSEQLVMSPIGSVKREILVKRGYILKVQ